jgi:hypothetical protein
MAPAPVDQTWANIVASATTSVDVPGTSDTVNMDTDPGSQVVGEMMSSAVSEGQGEPVPASLEGLQPKSDYTGDNGYENRNAHFLIIMKSKVMKSLCCLCTLLHNQNDGWTVPYPFLMVCCKNVI